MTDKTENPTVLIVARLSANRPHPFRIEPTAPEAAQMAEELGVLALRKIRFEGALHPDGKANWRLEATLGATVVQSCIVTLDPVTTRIEETVTRKFQKDWPGVDTDAEEVEMPEDETIDPLEDEIDLIALLQEALALALPAYPRSTDAEMTAAQFAPPGVTPLSDADAKPFAALAALKDQMKNED